MNSELQRVKQFNSALFTKTQNLAPKTKVAYFERMAKFEDWLQHQSQSHPVFLLGAYVEYLKTHLEPRSVQAHLSTIKTIIKTQIALNPSADSATFLAQLDLVKAPSIRGNYQGQRLTKSQRRRLINLPGTDTHLGRRDTSILSLMAICGLRRSEVINLNWGQITELDSYYVIRNIYGKHGRLRTVKLPKSLYTRMLSWGQLAELDMSADAPVFVRVRRGDHVQQGERLTSSAMAYVLRKYAKQIDVVPSDISPHDMRRTAAKLARENGATIEKVQTLLGHSSPQTTSAYIGDDLDLEDHAVDYVDMDVP